MPAWLTDPVCCLWDPKLVSESQCSTFIERFLGFHKQGPTSVWVFSLDGNDLDHQGQWGKDTSGQSHRKNSNTNIQGLIGTDEKVAFGQSGGLVLMLSRVPVRDFFKENFWFMRCLFPLTSTSWAQGCRIWLCRYFTAQGGGGWLKDEKGLTQPPTYYPKATLHSELHPQGEDSPFLTLIGYPKEGCMKTPPFFLISSFLVLSKWWKWSRSVVFGPLRPHGL